MKIIVIFLLVFQKALADDESFVLDSELPYDCGFANITESEYQTIARNVTFGTWPWIGALFSKDDQNQTKFVGNTILIHESISLAGLRQTFPQYVEYSVIFGKPDDESYQELQVSKRHLYFGYKYTFFDLDDISVLLLSGKVRMGTYVRPICLWEARETSLDVYEKEGVLASVDENAYATKNELVLRHEPAQTITAVLCMTLNFYSTDVNTLKYTEVSEQQLCVNVQSQNFCPPTSTALFFARESIDGRTQFYLRGLAIMRIFATNLPTQQCQYGMRKWVMIDVAQRRQFIDSHLKKVIRCGKRQLIPTALIKDGADAKPGHWPWHVAIFHKNVISKKDSYVCGGSSLNKYTILTSGHCVTVRSKNTTLSPGIFTVELGRYYLQGDEITAQKRYVDRVVLYPQYNATSLKHDVALLKLKTPALYNDYIQPVCLWESDKLSKTYIIEKLGKVVGWGRTSESELSSKLQEISMPVVNDTVCFQSHAFFSKFLTDEKYCAGYQNGSGACNGDSGGGMYFGQTNDLDTVWYQRGIVSQSLGYKSNRTCDLRQYVLFIDIVHYLDWIKLYL